MFLKNGIKKYIGLTLIEMLVALAVNMILLAALLAILASYINHYNRTSHSAMLDQQLQTAMQIMVNDIRRAGYWANASTDVNTAGNNNPFQASNVDIAVNGSNNCILFAYDYDNNGTLPSISSGADDERYGFRLISGTLQARPPGATFSCTAATNNWENLTNSNVVTITALTFILNTYSVPAGQANPSMKVRSVDITLTGRLVADTSIIKTITQHVRIRNDKYVP